MGGLDFIMKRSAGELHLLGIPRASGVPRVILMLYSLFQTASVTEKCSRAPAFVNSLATAEDTINLNRQYVVQYMEHSAAGLYIKRVRITTMMVFKFAYFAASIMCALLLQFSR